MKTGARFETVELSTIDTTLLARGRALLPVATSTARTPSRREIRALADTLYRRIEWDWASAAAARSLHGLDAGGGFPHDWDWRGYDEAMILYILALGSPTHPDRAGRLAASGRQTYQWGTLSTDRSTSTSRRSSGTSTRTSGSTSAGSGTPTCAGGASTTSRTPGARPMPSARTRSRIPAASRDYGADVWGLTACDGPLDGDRDDRRAAAQLPHLLPRGAASTARRRSTTARSPRRRRPPRSRSRPEIAMPAISDDAPPLRGRTSREPLRLPRRLQPDARRPRDPLAPRASSTGRRLVRRRPARHRPGADRRDDRELPHGARLEDHAQEPLRRRGPAPRGLHRRMARLRRS